MEIFVSYAFKHENDSIGFGNLTANVDRRIGELSDLDSAKREIERRNDGKVGKEDIVILFFKELTRTRKDKHDI